MGRLRLRRRTGGDSDGMMPLGRTLYPERYRAAVRTAQWSAYFNRFYGGAWGGDQIPSGLVPVSYREATDLLAQVLNLGESKETRAKDPQRDPLGRTLSQMLLAGYRPSDAPDRRVVCNAVGETDAQADHAPSADAAALATQRLLAGVETEFPKETPFRRQVFSLEDELDREERGKQQPVSVPALITHRGDAFSLQKTVYYRQDLTPKLISLVNPLNWTELGDYFTLTERGDGMEADSGPNSWHGVLHEKFRVDWNGHTTQTFDQYLKIDYTAERAIARTDYLLMYEVDDQIALNEGYFEAREESGEYEGWMSVTMVKTVKFTSSVLNLMAPAVLAMFLDSKEGGFRAFVAQESR